jgi:hypothetical protein
MRTRSQLAALSLLSLVLAGPASARPGGWDGPGWGAGSWRDSRRADAPADRLARRDRSDEGRIAVARFVGDRPEALGHGAITVTSGAPGQDYVPQDNRAAFEAAVVDRLVQAGYDTAQAQPADGQVAELTVTRTVVEPAEVKRKPVSGSAAMSVGTGGSAYGLALNVDLSKPLPPLVATKLEARIRDRASGAVLWEGRAEVSAREGDDKWSEQAIAAKLAQALFDGFPRASDGV